MSFASSVDPAALYIGLLRDVCTNWVLLRGRLLMTRAWHHRLLQVHDLGLVSRLLHVLLVHHYLIVAGLWGAMTCLHLPLVLLASVYTVLRRMSVSLVRLLRHVMSGVDPVQCDACWSLLNWLVDWDIVTLICHMNSLALSLIVLCHHLFGQLIDELLFSLSWLFCWSSLAWGLHLLSLKERSCLCRS